MNPSRSIAIALALVSSAILTGCQTTGTTQTAENRIRVSSGAYQGDGPALGGDIKSILMAGGLDVSNPMAPTGDTNRSEIAKTKPPEYNTDAMIAALSNTTTRTASAAQTLKPTRLNPVEVPSAKPSTALALVAERKPAPRKTVVLDTKIEEPKVKPIELASINMSTSSGDDAFDPIPVEEKKAKVVTEAPAVVVERAAPPVLATSASASTKTSRIRRF